MSDSPRKETLSSRTADLLRRDIVSGRLAPGAKINLDRLRAEHGISISPLREAVSRLVPDGLVTFEDQRGYAVASVSAEDLAEVTLMRAELEGLALRRAMAQGGLGWESGVVRALHLWRRTPGPVTRAGFHAAVTDGCAMPRLQATCRLYYTLHDRYVRLYAASDPLPANHDAIAAAILEHATDRAVTTLRDHVLRIGEFLAERFRQVPLLRSDD